MLRSALYALLGGGAAPPATWPHQPDGATLIGQTNDSALPTAGWGFHDNAPANCVSSVAANANAPVSPPDVYQIACAVGFSSNDAPSRQYLDIAPADQKRVTYVGSAVYVSANYRNNPTGNNKLHYIGIADGNGGVDCLVVIEIGGTGDPDMSRAMRPYVAFESMFGTLSGGHEAIFLGNLNSTVQFTRNVEYKLYIRITANTAGNADGRFEMWIYDGVTETQTHDITGIEYSSTGAFVKSVRQEFIWGGIGGVMDQACTVQFDHCYVSGSGDVPPPPPGPPIIFGPDNFVESADKELHTYNASYVRLYGVNANPLTVNAASDDVRCADANGYGAYAITGLSEQADVEVKLTCAIPFGFGGAGVMARLDANGNGYSGWVNGSNDGGTVKIQRITDDGATVTDLASFASPGNSLTGFYLAVSGYAPHVHLEVGHAGGVIGTFDDTDAARPVSGDAGVQLYNFTPGEDSFDDVIVYDIS